MALCVALRVVLSTGQAATLGGTKKVKREHRIFAENAPNGNDIFPTRVAEQPGADDATRQTPDLRAVFIAISQFDRSIALNR